MTGDEIAAIPAQIQALDVLYKTLDVAWSARHQAWAAGVNLDELASTREGLDRAFNEVHKALAKRIVPLPAPEDAP